MPEETDKLKKKFRAGFTMVEVVVMLAIITAISTLVLFSFTGLNEGAGLTRSARELALAVRRAQNMSLAVTQIDTSTGPKIPPAVGLQLSLTTPSTYFIFADLLRNNKYDALQDAKVGQDENFERRIRINSLKDKSGVGYSTVNIIFAAPEATVTIADATGNSIGESVTVELNTPSGQIRKTLVVRTSGQVSIR